MSFYEDGVKLLKNTIESIPGSGFVKSNLSDLSIRGAAEMNVKQTKEALQGVIDSGGKAAGDVDILEAVGQSAEEIARADEVAKQMSKGAETALGDLNSAEKLHQKAFAGGQGTPGVKGGIVNTLKNYYSGADVADAEALGTGIKRGVATVGGSVAVGTVLRGGSATRNEYGERDIAGIPFI